MIKETVRLGNKYFNYSYFFIMAQRSITKRFLVNRDPGHLEVHDLQDERKGCQIDEIQDYFYLDYNSNEYLEQWLSTNRKYGYDGCKYCLEKYHWK